VTVGEATPEVVVRVVVRVLVPVVVTVRRCRDAARRLRDVVRRWGDDVMRRWAVVHRCRAGTDRGTEAYGNDGRAGDRQDANGRQSPTESCSEHCTHVRQPFRPVPSEPAVRPRQPLAGQR